MRIPDLLTPAEQRLAVLLFILSAIGAGVQVGERLSPEVEAWLWEGERLDPAPVPHSTPAARSVPLGPAPPAAPSPFPPPGNSSPGGVDLNRADRAALQGLPGVGPVLAERILEDRKHNGPFRSVEDLRRVKGIGEKTLERIRPHVAVP